VKEPEQDPRSAWPQLKFAVIVHNPRAVFLVKTPVRSMVHIYPAQIVPGSFKYRNPAYIGPMPELNLVIEIRRITNESV
jgi:hypothetical protein